MGAERLPSGGSACPHKVLHCRCRGEQPQQEDKAHPDPKTCPLRFWFSPPPSLCPSPALLLPSATSQAQRITTAKTPKTQAGGTAVNPAWLRVPGDAGHRRRGCGALAGQIYEPGERRENQRIYLLLPSFNRKPKLLLGSEEFALRLCNAGRVTCAPRSIPAGQQHRRAPVPWSIPAGLSPTTQVRKGLKA